MSDEQQKKEREPRWWLWMLGTGLVVILVLVAVACLQYWVVDNFVVKANDDVVTRFGVSGDFFGFSNALFSALAFAMIIVTLWMQKYELKQQRNELDQTQKIMELQVKEMELQREEMQNQKQEMQEQSESLRLQRFESTFFRMLELHNQVVGEMISHTGKKRGREAFTEFVHELDPRFPALGHEFNQKISKRTLDECVAAYESWYDENEHHVGHYFRTLYNLFRYIDEHGPGDKSTFSRLARAQLSRGELDLLLLNGLSRYGREKFKPLIVRFNLVKHVRETEENRILLDAYFPAVLDKPSDEERA